MDGILLMAYGTPSDLEDVERYYTEILRGKKPSAEQLEKLEKRYTAAGLMPLLEITKRQATKLQDMINIKRDDALVYCGMKYSDPHIKEAIITAMRDGVSRLVCIPIAPFYSRIGTGSYFDKVREAAKELGYRGKIINVDFWYDESGLTDAWFEKLQICNIDKSFVMLFTAHSLPISNEDDLGIYRKQIIHAANQIEKRYGCKWSLAFQSAADLPGKWIGPELMWQTKKLYENGIKKIVIIPIGFVSDNLETIYDVGIELAGLCKDLGIEYKITQMPNDSDGIIHALYSVYKKALKNQ